MVFTSFSTISTVFKMKKQTCVLAMTSMLATASEYIGVFLLKLSKLFMAGATDEREKTPLFVDVACQTDDLTAAVHYYYDVQKHDDSRSSFTKEFDISNDQMDCSTSDDSDWSEASQGDNSLIRVKHYLCMCGSCPHYKEISTDVSRIPGATSQEKRSTTRLLQAFATYDEDAGYCVNMISTARECLRLWNGDEDKAFNLFVSLHDEICKCDIFSLDTVCTRCDRMVPSLITGGALC